MRWLQALYVANGLAIGALFLFASVLLQSRGFDPALIGIAGGLGALSYSLSLPVWGHIGDIVSGPRRAIQLASVPAGIAALGLNLPLPPAGLMLVVVAYTAFGGPCAALTDAIALPVLTDPSRQYGRLRLLSSIGCGLGTIACGLLYEETGYFAAPFLFAASMGLILVCAQMVPMGRDCERLRQSAVAPAPAAPPAASAPVGAGAVAEPQPHGRFGSVSAALGGRPRLVAVLFSVLLVFLAVMSIVTFMSIRVADLGGGPAWVGLINGAASLAEVPGLILGGWLVARLGLRPVLVFGTAGLAACLASWMFLTEPPAILATRFLSGIFFGTILVVFVVAISGLLPASLQSTGQTLFQATCYGVASIGASLAGGLVYQGGGAGLLFGAAAVCAALGGIAGFAALPRLRVAAASGRPGLAPSPE